MMSSSHNDLTDLSADRLNDGLENWSAMSQAPATAHQPVRAGDLSLVLDLPVRVLVELGRAKLSFRDLAQIEDGSVVELDTPAGKPVNMMVNGCLVARGEIVIVNERYGLRVTDIIAPSERFTSHSN